MAWLFHVPTLWRAGVAAAVLWGLGFVVHNLAGANTDYSNVGGVTAVAFESGVVAGIALLAAPFAMLALPGYRPIWKWLAMWLAGVGGAIMFWLAASVLFGIMVHPLRDTTAVVVAANIVAFASLAILFKVGQRRGE